jgi:catalase
LVGNNLPVIFIRDAIKVPDMAHSLKPSPTDNLQSIERFFDFFSQVPGATNMPRTCTPISEFQPVIE